MSSQITLGIFVFAVVLSLVLTQNPEQQALDAASQVAQQVGNVPFPGADIAAEMGQQGIDSSSGFLKQFKPLADVPKNMASQMTNMGTK
ncbi:hypothetical protein HHI36_022135 [Cryptolaemus montrouzieri]|uniref:Uncharacterized protein n=1 Tax=Cryptolaemus montrouzieri TaxID=559131 RepID=A0ABD2MZQ0_9CUCU